MITYGKGKYRVWVKKETVGDDLVLILGGGERSHIGGLVLCEPGKSPQVIRREGHFDDLVLFTLADAACAKYKTTVVAVGGVHVDHATQEEIDLLVKNCHGLLDKI